MTWLEMREVFKQMTLAQHEAMTEVVALSCMGNPFDEQFTIGEDGRINFTFSERMQMVADKVAEFASPPASVLDVGCWQGHLAIHLLQQGYYAGGIDLSHASANRATGRIVNLPEEARKRSMGFWQGWAHEVLPRLGQYDLVVCEGMLEHVPDEVLPQTCDALVAATKHVLIVQVPGWDDLWPLHLRVFTSESLVAAVARPGWIWKVAPGPCLMAWGVRE